MKIDFFYSMFVVFKLYFFLKEGNKTKWEMKGGEVLAEHSIHPSNFNETIIKYQICALLYCSLFKTQQEQSINYITH